MRASDLERQRTIDELRRHCAAGRIDVDEYATRIEKAMSATTLEELDHLRSDLPMMRIADPVGGAGGTIRGRPVLAGADPGGTAGTAPGARLRLTAVAVAVLSVLVVLAVVALALVAEWAWAVVLVAGWLAGLATGRLSRAGGWPR
ncbi:MAG TPA: DUF1707 domain-containing protein [Acidimicrobiales bacterium]|nr:DUF1707 domain-containing protein [Acidimicrobiales bacterium]